MRSINMALVAAGAAKLAQFDHPNVAFETLAESVRNDYCERFQQAFDAMEQANDALSDRYHLDAVVYRRRDEWVLEIEGTIEDTGFISRHTQPLSVAPQDVPGLPTIYELVHSLEGEEPVALGI